MHPRPPRSLRALPALAVAVAALTAGAGVAAGGAAFGRPGPPPPVASETITLPDAGKVADWPSLPGVTWSVGSGDFVRVHGSRCPKSHPRKVGSFSWRSTTQVNGNVRTRSHTGVICAR